MPTPVASAILNLNAGEEVLQEQGLQITTNGLSVGAADAGIIESTKTVLSSADQPTAAGIPAQVMFANTVAAAGAAGYGTVSMSFDIADGNGPQAITLAGVAAGATVQEVLNDIQSALDATFGSQQLRAVENPSTGELIIERAGYNATNGTSFAITTTAGWDAAFGVAGAVTPGVAGQQLFVGASPVTADFRSIPGTQTTTRTTATPPLGIVSSDPGQFAVLTANNSYSPLDISTGSTNVLAFSIARENGTTYSINLSQAAWTTGVPAGGFGNVNGSEIVAEINNQIAPNTDVVAVLNGGRIEFQVQAPGARGDFVQIADNSGTSVNYDLVNLGFLSNNRIDAGVEPVQANNEFNLEVTSATGNAGGPFTITIPPANYANLDALAVASQQQID
ncbi:MAG: flagellar biosynthesis protein FlgE, partial [Thalassolituus sp.]